jgi:hypothetical protein
MSVRAPPLRAAAARMRAAWCNARDSRLVTDATGKPVREKREKGKGAKGVVE